MPHFVPKWGAIPHKLVISGFSHSLRSGNPEIEPRHALVFKLLTAPGAELVASAHTRIAHRAEQNQLHATRSAGCIFLADRRTTLRAEGLTAGPAPILAGFDPGMACRALVAEIEAASGAFGHLRRQVGATARAAKLQLCAAGSALGVVFPHSVAAGWAERKAAIGAFSQSQPHVGLAPGAGPAGVKPTIGAVYLLVLQQQVALGTCPLAAFLAGAQLAAVFGSALRAFE
jgi:hypothetical protein